jgi:methyltransferase (TIGR00027 family)
MPTSYADRSQFFPSFILKAMQTGRASKTALGVAIRRAAHQLADCPPVLDDPIALRLVVPGYARRIQRAMHRVGRDSRAFMAVRSRFVEDQLARSVACGVVQYVVLGAGFDTFAYRNPFPALRVFELDFPATQADKRSILAESGILPPTSLTFVPLDLERNSLAQGLAASGFDPARPAFFSCLGVIPFLTLEAFRSTFEAIAQLPAPSAVGFDYALAPETLPPPGRVAFRGLSRRVARAGEPFQLFFTPEQLDSELRRAGFLRSLQLGYQQLNQLYFNNRADRLKLSAAVSARLATAWVSSASSR